MTELSLFSGASGGLLGTLLLGWRHIGYVEFNDYCQRVIAQRIADGILPVAPIFGDIRTFISEGHAELYRGVVDVLSGGFPCQPFSVAGKRKGADDERNMWPATIECVRIIRPRFCFFENVPGLLNSGYFGTVVADLAACGYGVRWRCLSAAELGAPHKRDRLWIVAHAQREQAFGLQQQGLRGGTGAGSMGNATSQGLQNGQYSTMGGCTQGDSKPQLERPSWWEVEPELDRLADGVPNRINRLKAAGNGQVPLCAALAFLLLAGGES